MTTVRKDYNEFQVKSGAGVISAGFDGVSLINFHTLSFLGSATAGTFNGVSLNGSFNYRLQFNAESATLPQCSNMIATIIHMLGKGR